MKAILMGILAMALIYAVIVALPHIAKAVDDAFMLTPFISIHGTFIFSADVMGIAEYIDLAVAKVKFMPFAARALIVSAVFLVTAGSGLSRVPSRSDMYSVFLPKPSPPVCTHRYA